MKNNRTTEILADPKPTEGTDFAYPQQPSNSSSADRRKPLGQVGLVIASTIVALMVGATTFTIEAKKVYVNGKENNVCPPGTHLERGMCVPDGFGFGDTFPSDPGKN